MILNYSKILTKWVDFDMIVLNLTSILSLKQGEEVKNPPILIKGEFKRIWIIV